MARSALDEWLDLVPANKIIGFGGDAFLWVEWIVGDLVQSRENIAAVLAKRVRAGTLSEESSLELAKTMLFDNSRALFGLDVDPSDEPRYK